MRINNGISRNNLSPEEIEQAEIIHTLQEICKQLQTKTNHASLVMRVLSSAPSDEGTKNILAEKVSKDCKALQLIQDSMVELRTSLNPTSIVEKLIKEAGLNPGACRLLQKYKKPQRVL